MQVTSNTSTNNTLVTLSNVGFAYGSHEVLVHTNLEIRKGDYLGVIGGNGAGKTTLLKLILGLLKPTAGSVQIAPDTVLGYVPQKMSFDIHFPATVRDVVAMGRVGQRGLLHRLTTEDHTAVEEALKSAHMWEARDKLIGELSGGQQQRVFIARALAARPQALFLDEPTAAVDVHAQEAFYALLSDLNTKRGIAIVLVSHDIDTVSREVSRIAFVEDTVIHYDSPTHFMQTHAYHSHAHVHTH